MKLLVLLALLTAPYVCSAASPMDFAGGFALQTQPGLPLQRLELPLDVYNASARADLGDLRVFNSAGDEVPMHLGRVAPQQAAARPLPMFLLPDGEGAGANADFRLQVRTSARGAVVETLVRPAQPEASRLLLDASAAGHLGALRFELQGISQLVRVTVRGSDDLAAWSPAGSGVLAHVEHAGGRVLQDRIALSGRAWKYYLVSGDGRVPAVSAAFGEPVGGMPERRFAPLVGVAVGNGTYEYNLPPGLPVDLLELGDTDNAVLGVTVLVPQKEGWRSAGRGSLFRLTVEGQRLSGPGLPLYGPMPRMRVALQGSAAPLRVGWLPHELIFMAQGEGPFTLAVGNPSVQGGPDLLTPMLRSGSAPLGDASLGPWTPLGGEGLLRPARSHTKMVLWAVLGLGVALLGAMALHLVRNLGDRPPA